MVWVRPGVLLVLAILAPTRALIRLDLPTLERPKKAISGTLGAGNCFRSAALVTNRARTFTDSISRLGGQKSKKSNDWTRFPFRNSLDRKRRVRTLPLCAKFPKEGGSLQLEWSFVFDVFGTDGAELVPEIQGHDDNNGDADANSEEDAISGKQDQQSDDRADADNKGRAAFNRASEHRVIVVRIGARKWIVDGR